MLTDIPSKAHLSQRVAAERYDMIRVQMRLRAGVNLGVNWNITLGRGPTEVITKGRF